MTTSSDKDWEITLKSITDPYQLLNELVDLATYCPVGDSYYKDLYEALINQAIVILSNRAHE